MGFPHCPICVVLAFVSVFMGVTRSYMFYILELRVSPIKTETNARTTQIGQCGNPIIYFPI